MSFIRNKQSKTAHDKEEKAYLYTIKKLKEAKILVFVSVFVVVGFAWVFFAKAQQVVSVPASIAADCSVDVADQLEDWLQALPFGVVVNMPQNGCYLTESSIRLNGKVGLVINGNNTTLKRTIFGGNDTGLRHITLSGCSGITIKDLNVLGRKPPEKGYQAAPEGQHGVSINGSENIVLDNLTIKHVFGDFVYVGRGVGRISKNVVIRNSLMEDSGRQGIAVTGGDTVLITHNDISGNNRSTIDLEPNILGDGADNVTIANNRIGKGKNYFLASLGGTRKVRNLVIANNELYGRGMSIIVKPPKKQRRGPITIIGNTTKRGGDRVLINLHRIDGVLIQDNNIAVGGLNLRGFPKNSMTRIEDVTNFKSINNNTLRARVSLVAKDSSNFCELNNTPISPEIPRCGAIPGFSTQPAVSSGNDDSVGEGVVSETQLPEIIEDSDPNEVTINEINNITGENIPLSPPDTANNTPPATVAPTPTQSNEPPVVSPIASSTTVPISSLVTATPLPNNSYRGTVSIKPPNTSQITSTTLLVDQKIAKTSSNPPYAVALDTREYKNGSHDLTLQSQQSNGQITEAKSSIVISNSPWYKRWYHNVLDWLKRGFISIERSLAGLN